MGEPSAGAGRGGKSSPGMPRSVYRRALPAALSVVVALSCEAMWIGPSGIILTRSSRSLAGHGDAAALAHVGRHAADERQVQVRRREAERARPVDGEQHVREHRHRALALGDALHARDELEQVLLGDREFHPAPSLFASLR